MHKYCYICSAARCGSTISDMFLGGHSRLASLGEINLIGKSIRIGNCSCGMPVKDCAEWGKVFSMLKQDENIDLKKSPYSLTLWDARAFVEIDREHQTRWFTLKLKLRAAYLEFREWLHMNSGIDLPYPGVLKRAVDNKLRLYDVILQAWGKDVVVDSSKNIREAVALYRKDPENVRIILVTRDGRGTYLSRRKSGWGRSDSLRGWFRYYRRALRMAKHRLPDDAYMMLHYEDLASDPEAAGHRICEFIGVDFEPGMLDLAAGDRHLVNGNDTRFTASRIKLDEKWKAELTGDEMEYFLKHGAAMNDRLGYE